MSNQNAERLIRHFMTVAWDEARIDDVDALVTASYTDHAYSGGIESLKAQIGQVREAFPNCRHLIEDLVADGDRVMLRARLQGKHTGPFRGNAPTDASIDVRVARWFRLEGEKIAEHWALLDTISLFRQIGAEIPAPAGR
ncbi:ester cyclase [Microvirga sp. 2MCAF38]|uniref:ester cyclase n=1 Tax=Microvirga sp. 2MCAF38 TaxID=3232989 RepID=UPI003F94544C